MNTSLEINNLSVSFNDGKDKVLHDVTAKLYQGELTALIGRNGAGKSTLLNTILGHLTADSGEITIQNKLVEKYSLKDKSKLLSAVRTSLPDLGYMTVREFVAMGRYPYTNWSGRLVIDDYEKVEKVISEMHIQNLSSKYLFELSDGERQKTIIARSLAQDTALILMDEPIAFIDPVASLEILQLMKNQCIQKKKSILYSSHDLASTFLFADKVWLIDNEGHVHFGSPEELLNNGLIEKSFGQEGYVLSQDLYGFRPEG